MSSHVVSYVSGLYTQARGRDFLCQAASMLGVMKKNGAACRRPVRASLLFFRRQRQHRYGATRQHGARQDAVPSFRLHQADDFRIFA